MKYRRFGRTELSMPVISCGGMRYQHKWQDVAPTDIPPDNQKNLEAVIHKALQLGINHIETARGYGSSEMQLGFILPHLPRPQMIVQTKVAPTANPEDFLRTFEKSMHYLRLDHVDLLSLHGINTWRHLYYALKPGGCVAAARQLQKQGRIRYLGFSTHAATDIILEAIQSDEFDYVNLHWYFVNPLNWPAIEAAHQKDMGVFIISPNDKGGKLYDPPRKLASLCHPLSPIAFNDIYCLAKPHVHTISCGASRPSDFDEHLKVLDYYDRLSETSAPIEARLINEIDHVLGKEWRMQWSEGIPNYEEIPGQINILEILRLWTYAKALDLMAWGQMRYNLLGHADHWFPGENAGRIDDLDLSACLAKSPFASKIPSILKEAHNLLIDAPRQRLSQGE